MSRKFRKIDLFKKQTNVIKIKFMYGFIMGLTYIISKMKCNCFKTQIIKSDISVFSLIM